MLLPVNTTYVEESSLSGSSLLSLDSLWWRGVYKRPQICCWVVVADEQLPCLSDVTLSQDRHVSLGMAALGLSSRTGGRAVMSPVGPPALTEHKVVVCGGAHGIKYVGFVGDLEL